MNKHLILYRGPSELDGKPIVVVGIYNTGSFNTKTGAMLQTYILVDGVDPREANKTGADVSICGQCPHKGTPHDDPEKSTAKGRSCYVQLGQGPLNVHRMVVAGAYPAASGTLDLLRFGSGRFVRLGTYGDPAAVPMHVWDALLADAKGHTGYSHQKDVKSAFRADCLMVSADTHSQAKAAWDQGLRTFRVVSSVTDIDKDNEILCPASKEAGRRVTCIDCRLCGGTSVNAKSIAIPAHGAGATHFGGQ